MDNVRRIDDFLKLMAGASKNGYQINSEFVYSNLIYLGVENKRNDISGNFSKWIDYFSNVSNIFVFVDPSWSYFCQFVNDNNRKNFVSGDVKLYIPVDSEHIERSAKEIFDFLARENITHNSKIGKRVRFDDIVIRVESKEDADKIIQFVNKNKYIQSGMLPANPFTVKDNNIAIAWDGMLSYNNVVSSWVSEYINYEKDRNNLDNVSFSQFYSYVYAKSKSLFNEGKGLDEYAHKLYLSGVIKHDNDSNTIDGALVNYYYVTKLLLLSLDFSNKKEDVYSFIDMVNNEEQHRKDTDYIHRLRVGKVNKNNMFTEQQKAALKLAYEYMREKYGYEDTKDHFLEFLYTGKYTAITRYKGARDLLFNNGIDKNVASSIVLSWKTEVLNDAIMKTYNKYGYDQAYGALMQMICYNDFSRFTNDYNARKNLIDRFQSGDSMKEVFDILRNDGEEIDFDRYDICQKYLDKVFGDGMNNGRHM